MELADIAGYFDHQSFDGYSPQTGWEPNVLQGQLRIADTFVSIWNRPTRRRMLFVTPDNEPQHTVLRPSNAPQDIFLVGVVHRDTNFDTHYRSTVTLHYASGVAEIVRREPVGPANNPGPAVDVVETITYADVELRSQRDDREADFYHDGNYFLFLPAGTPLEKRRFVRLNGVEYLVEEVYQDGGFLSARVTSRPDERITLTYYSATAAPSYNATTGQVTRPSTPYSVTARVNAFSAADSDGTNIQVGDLEVSIQQTYLGVQPKPEDEVEVYGVRYRVLKVWQDPLRREWHLQGRLA